MDDTCRSRRRGVVAVSVMVVMIIRGIHSLKVIIVDSVIVLVVKLLLLLLVQMRMGVDLWTVDAMWIASVVVVVISGRLVVELDA